MFSGGVCRGMFFSQWPCKSLELLAKSHVHLVVTC